MNADAREYREKHQYQILLDEITHRQADADALSGQPCSPAHDKRYSKKRDYAADGSERHG